MLKLVQVVNVLRRRRRRVGVVVAGRVELGRLHADELRARRRLARREGGRGGGAQRIWLRRVLLLLGLFLRIVVLQRGQSLRR